MLNSAFKIKTCKQCFSAAELSTVTEVYCSWNFDRRTKTLQVHESTSNTNVSLNLPCHIRATSENAKHFSNPQRQPVLKENHFICPVFTYFVINSTSLVRRTAKTVAVFCLHKKLTTRFERKSREAVKIWKHSLTCNRARSQALTGKQVNSAKNRSLFHFHWVQLTLREAPTLQN